MFLSGGMYGIENEVLDVDPDVAHIDGLDLDGRPGLWRAAGGGVD
jgi:hypothetical protein